MKKLSFAILLLNSGCEQEVPYKVLIPHLHDCESWGADRALTRLEIALDLWEPNQIIVEDCVDWVPYPDNVEIYSLVDQSYHWAEQGQIDSDRWNMFFVNSIHKDGQSYTGFTYLAHDLQWFVIGEDKGLKTIAHELGHMFGLDHVKDDSDNVMFPSDTDGPFVIEDWQIESIDW